MLRFLLCAIAGATVTIGAADAFFAFFLGPVHIPCRKAQHCPNHCDYNPIYNIHRLTSFSTF